MFRIGRSHERGAPTSWRRRVFTLAALFAVFLQSFVIQTHIHTPSLVIGAEQGAAHDPEPSFNATAADQKSMCALCQALSNSGATITGSAVLLDAEISSASHLIALSLAPRTLSHFWQSRAPPSLL